jgi:glycosyltransferase involved in cell wall biosynthesis
LNPLAKALRVAQEQGLRVVARKALRAVRRRRKPAAAQFEELRVTLAGRAAHPRRTPSERRPGPLRVLAHSSFTPTVSETYMLREMEILVELGYEVEFATPTTGIAPASHRFPVHVGPLNEAVRAFDPDLLFLYWAVHARDAFADVTESGVPFGFRVHSFDFDAVLIEQIQTHPLCAGVWVYPQHAEVLRGVRVLPTLFSRGSEPPFSQGRRDVVLSASACLPKKDFPTLVKAFADLETGERRVVIAATNGFEDLPGEVLHEVAKHRHPPLVQMNLNREEVYALFERAAALVYTLDDKQDRFGQPSSIAEGLLSGAIVVVPERYPEIHAVAGPSPRLYRDAADLTRHLREILSEGEALSAEREANREWARGRYASPELRRRFADDVAGALNEWWAPLAQEGLPLSVG